MSLDGNKDIFNTYANGSTGEQLAIFDSAKNITQVSNLASGSVIGGGIIDGQATSAQLAQENTLVSQLGAATSFSSSGSGFLSALGIQSGAAAMQALVTADSTYTGSNVTAAPTFTSDAALGNWVANKATDGSATYAQSSARIDATATDLTATPVQLALEDGPLAVAMARQHPDTLNVLIALQKLVLAGGYVSPTVKDTTASLLGTDSKGVDKLLMHGGSALISIVEAYRNPTPIGIASALQQVLSAGIPITDTLKLASARALKLGQGNDAQAMADMGDILAYGGAGLAVVSVLKNPTPQNIVMASQQTINVIDRITQTAHYSQLQTALGKANIAFSLLDFSKNPNPNTALNAMLSIGMETPMAPLVAEIAAVVTIAEAVLPGPTQSIINGVYNAGKSIVSAARGIVQGIGNAISSIAGGIGNAVSSLFGGIFGPLTLNLVGGDVHTTTLAAGSPLFDMKGDGSRVRTGWITPDQGFLVRDLNGNGRIDSVREMFSEANSTTGKSAFGTLAELDSNHDGRIDKNDAAFNQLKVWVDKNGDGVSQANELYTLGQLGIASIDLNAKHNFSYDNGNLIGDTSSFTRTDGSRGQIADAIFATGAAGKNPFITMGGNATTVRLSNGETAAVLSGSGQKINVSDKGINVVISQGGNTVTAGNTNGIVLMGAKGDVLNAGSGANTTLVGNGGASLTGNASRTRLIANGTGNILTTGSGTSDVQVNGSGNLVNATLGTARIAVAGSGNNIAAGSGNTLSVTGNANRLTLGSNDVLTSTGSGNSLNITGTGDAVSMSNGSVTMGDNASLSLLGGNNAISVGTYDTLSVAGNGNALSTRTETTTRTSTTYRRLGRRGYAVRNSITTDITGAGDSISISGTGNTADLNNTRVSVGDYSSVSIAGSNNAVAVGSNSALSVAGNADRIVAGANNSLTVSGNGNSVSAAGGNSLDISGTGNTANLNNGSVSVGNGSSASVAGSNNAIAVGSNSALSVAGNADRIAAGASNRLTVNGNGNSVSATGSGNSLGITGSGDTVKLSNGSITLGGHSSLSLLGSSNAVNIGSYDILNVIGNNNALSARTDMTTVGRRQRAVSLSGIGDSIGILGTGDTVRGVAASQVHALAAAQANSLVSAMGSFAPPAAGQIAVLASSRQRVPVLIAAAH